MPRLSVETRQRVTTLRDAGYKYKEIKAKLKEEGIVVSRTTLSLLVKKYQETGRVADRPSGRKPKKLHDEHYIFIDKALARDDELTTVKLFNLLMEEFPELNASFSTVKRARRELGWACSTPITKYCQMIREANKAKRLDGCQEQTGAQEDFSNVICTDECSEQIDPHRLQERWRAKLNRGQGAQNH